MTAELFIELLKKMMKGRNRPVRLIVDGLPAHKKVNVREYIESTAWFKTRDFCVTGTSLSSLRETQEC
ncbi:hypothetical protein AU476_36840 [Cupriavidus sp. UYMSc13B]|nr:hypothetical protein AU476_36840 [Cupriavidus sp. UYMSc13B]